MSTPDTNDEAIKVWLKTGDIEKLEEAVINGYGDQLRNKTSRIPKINNFLKQVPHFQSKIDAIHEAVAQGKLREVQSLLDRKKLAMSRTQTGASPLHTAVLNNQINIAKYILEKFPTAIQARDNQGRTAFHYAAVANDGGEMYKLLEGSGADKKATDMRGKIPEYYLQNPEELPLKSLREGIGLNKVTRRSDRRNDRGHNTDKDSLSVPSKIEVRMLIQKADLNKLESIVLNGYGDRLLGESSVNSRVKEFLDQVPGFMIKVANLHSAAVEGSIRDVRNLIDRRTMVIAKDPYGANVLHRAVIHNHYNIVKYLINNYPEAINAIDFDGRTPLHYSVVVEDDRIYKTLIGAGADESITDNNKIECLHEAALNGNLRQLKNLIDRKQLAKSKHNGLGLLHKSLMYNHPHITSYICQKYPDALLVTDNEGRFPLHFAAVVADDGSAYQSLLDTGADPQAIDGKGNTPIYYKEHPEELDLLEMQNRINRMRSRINAIKNSSGSNKEKYGGGFRVTRANIRKWIHAEDLEKLNRVVYEGHGTKLLVETSSSSKVKEFLKSVPNLIGKIRDVHSAAQGGNLAELQQKADSKQLFLSKDIAGISPLHKAVIMGHRDVSKYIIQECPDAVKARDYEGKTPMHYAAALPKDDNFIYNMLLEAGGDDQQLDEKGKSPEYYQQHPAEAELRTTVIKLNRKLPEIHVSSYKPQFRRKPPNNLPIAKNSNKSLKGISYGTLSPEHVTKLVNLGDIDKLEQLVLEGYGKKLYGKTSWIEEVRNFLKKVPAYMDRIYAVHKATAKGDLKNVEELMDNKKLVIAKDGRGLTPLHRAVKYGKTDIVKFMLQMYPAAVHITDKEGRTPLHLAGMYKNRDIEYKLLEHFGADNKLIDSKSKTPEEYQKSNMKLEIQSPESQEGSEDSGLKSGEAPTADELQEENDINTWIEKDDIENLERLIIDGKGDLLLGKSSNKEKTKEFLECVPITMGKIRAIHTTTVEGDLRGLQSLIDKRQYATVRDNFGACPLHVALLYGHNDIVRYLGNSFPASLNVQDFEGRTPLHYAAIAGDDGMSYRFLHKHGADPNIKDKNGCTPGHYLRGKAGSLSFDSLLKRYEEKKIPPRPPSVQTWQRPPTAEILRALTPDEEEHENDESNATQTQDETETHDDSMPALEKMKSESPVTTNENIPTESELATQNEEIKEGNTEETDEPPEQTNEDTTEPLAEDQSEEPTEKQKETTEDQSEEPTEDQSEELTEKQSEEPTAEPPEEPTEEKPEKPTEEKPEEPTEEKPEELTEEKPEEPTEEKPEEPTEEKPEEPTEEKSEEPTEEKPEEPTEGKPEKSKEENPEEPTEEKSEEPTEEQPENSPDGNPEEPAETLEADQTTEKPETKLSEEPTQETSEKTAETESEKKPPEEVIEEPPKSHEEDNTSEIKITDDSTQENENPNEAEQENPENPTQSTEPTDPEMDKNTEESNPEIAAIEAETKSTKEEESIETQDAEHENPPPTNDNNKSTTTPTPNGLRAKHLSRNHSSLSTPDNPMWSKEGEYLASAMGDALIKALTEVSHRRPKDPIGYLAIWLYLHEMRDLGKPDTPYLDKEIDDDDPLMNSTGLDKVEMGKGLYEARLARSSSHKSSRGSSSSPVDNVNVIGQLKDESGKTILHFAASKRHEGNALWNLLFYTNCNLAEKDANYLTARDIAEDVNLIENVNAIDKFIGTLIINDKLDQINGLMLNSYEHILDVKDPITGEDILSIVEKQNKNEMLTLLRKVKPFQEQVNNLHLLIVFGDLNKVKELINEDLAIAKSPSARCSLHIAVLHEQMQIIEYIASSFPATVKAVDNMWRTPLHYAMGVENSQAIAKILIQYGASRQSRDVKFRTPSFYFVEPQEIANLISEISFKPSSVME